MCQTFYEFLMQSSRPGMANLLHECAKILTPKARRAIFNEVLSHLFNSLPQIYVDSILLKMTVKILLIEKPT